MDKNERILLVGHCDADTAMLRDMLENQYSCGVEACHQFEEVQSLAESHPPVRLVLVNRVLDRCGSSGVELIQQLKSNSVTQSLPVMLISNFDWAQQEAQQAGALPGFGKAEVNQEQTRDLISAALAQTC